MRSRRRGGFFTKMLVNASDAITHYMHNADRKRRARRTKTPERSRRRESGVSSLPVVNIPGVRDYDRFLYMPFQKKFFLVHQEISASDAVVVYVPSRREYGMSKQPARNGCYVDVGDCTVEPSNATNTFACKITFDPYGRHARINSVRKGFHFVMSHESALGSYLSSIVEICFGRMHRNEVAYKYPRLVTFLKIYYFEDGEEKAVKTGNNTEILVLNPTQKYAAELNPLWEDYDLVSVSSKPNIVVVTENSPDIRSKINAKQVVDIGGVTLEIPVTGRRDFIVTDFESTKSKLKVENGGEGKIVVVHSDDLKKYIRSIFRYIVEEDDDFDTDYKTYSYQFENGKLNTTLDSDSV